MNDSAKLHPGQLALLSAFFDDDGFDALARDERFGRYVLTQKELLRTLLVRGFKLLGGHVEEAPAPAPAPTRAPARAAAAAAAPTAAAAPSSTPAVAHAPATPSTLAPATPPSTAQASAPPALPSTGALAADEVLRVVTELCAAKTGYPLDLLEPQLDLEADLGIDTIKQMELVAAVRDRFGVARVEGYALKQTPTLAALRDFVLAHAPAR